jgi:hypothetical protein
MATRDFGYRVTPRKRSLRGVKSEGTEKCIISDATTQQALLGFVCLWVARSERFE